MSSGNPELDAAFENLDRAVADMTEGARALAQREPHPDDWKPLPGPQTRFLSLRTFEALYGGAAGGGKSDALLIDAIRYVGKGYGGKYKALLLRRTFPDLEKSLIARSHELYPRIGGVYNEQKKCWTFPGGEKVFFGYLENDKDLLQYQGAAFQFIGFDELTHFSYYQYIYLFSRCRSAHGVPCRIRGATNPGGPGHAWVMKRWGAWLDPKSKQEPAAAGEVRYFEPLADGTERQVPKGTMVLLPGDKPGQEVPAPGRVFVPASLDDNPYLLADPAYRTALAMLDPLTRERLRRGNWLLVAGKKLFFDRAWVEIIHYEPKGLDWVRVWDFAATAPSKENPDPDWTRGTRMAMWGERLVIADVVSLRGDPGSVDELLRTTAEADGKACTQILPQDPGAAGKTLVAHYQRLLRGYPIRVARASEDKVTRFKPFSGFASPPHKGVVVVHGDWNDPLFDELEAFPEGGHDDIVDTISDGFNELADGFCPEPRGDDFLDLDDDRTAF